jgi:phosphocarrier protein
MVSKTLVIKNKLGLHARAASAFVKTSSSYGARITVINTEREADGKSIMSMMMLQAGLGSEIIVTTEGDDENEAMAAIEALIDDRFGEDE